MLYVPVEIKKSEIHGYGIFAAKDIRQGTVIWEFTPGIDQIFSDFYVKYSEPRVRDFIRRRGYINPNKPTFWVLPADESQFWNFAAKEPNCEMGGIVDGEHLILAARDISSGEELSVPPESDLDYERKMSEHEP